MDNQILNFTALRDQWTAMVGNENCVYPRPHCLQYKARTVEFTILVGRMALCLGEMHKECTWNIYVDMFKNCMRKGTDCKSDATCLALKAALEARFPLAHEIGTHGN